MKIRVLEFAEYASFTDDKKLIMGGIFNRMGIARKPNAIPGASTAVPIAMQGFLVWVIEASIGDGLKHKVALRIRDDDGNIVLNSQLGDMVFHLDQHGRPMRFQGRLQLTGLPLPGPGEYEFELHVNGNKVGETSLYVDDVTPPTP
jgi:hypothetical protein